MWTRRCSVAHFPHEIYYKSAFVACVCLREIEHVKVLAFQHSDCSARFSSSSRFQARHEIARGDVGEALDGALGGCFGFQFFEIRCGVREVEHGKLIFRPDRQLDFVLALACGPEAAGRSFLAHIRCGDSNDGRAENGLDLGLHGEVAGGLRCDCQGECENCEMT